MGVNGAKDDLAGSVLYGCGAPRFWRTDAAKDSRPYRGARRRESISLILAKSRGILHHPVLARKIVRRMSRHIPSRIHHIYRGRVDRRLHRVIGHIFGGWLTSVGQSLGRVRKHHRCSAVGVIPGKIARAGDYLPLLPCV